jgi:uncharacterized protein
VDRLIVDTGPLIAAINRRDRYHAVATRVLGRARSQAVVPDPVAVEVELLARRRYGAEASRAFLAAMDAGVHRRAPVDKATFARAVKLDADYADLGLGLVDAVVMALVERTGWPVFTLDFRDFRAVPGPVDGTWPFLLSEDDLAAGS